MLNPDVPLPNSAQYALAPPLSKLVPLFDAGKMAVLLNVGTLNQPTTKAQFKARVGLPPKLMSHNDQQSYWQAGVGEGKAYGWGGLIGDKLVSLNATNPDAPFAPALTCMNLSSNAVFLTGQQVRQYAVTPQGPVCLNAKNSLVTAMPAAVLQQLIRGNLSSGHIMQDALGAIGSRSLDLYDTVTAALLDAPKTSTVFPPMVEGTNNLGEQLSMVAKIISVSQKLGLKRQVFLVGATGFDTHDGLNTVHPLLLQNLADALRAFHDTTVELGVDKQVTTFTASDFGRALNSNKDGSDHGWGSMHFVLGGSVKGRNYYGINPKLGNDDVNDIGQGRLIPTTSVDQYGATLARWFGVDEDSLPRIFPNIRAFKKSPTYPLDTDLGFMTSPVAATQMAAPA